MVTAAAFRLSYLGLNADSFPIYFHQVSEGIPFDFWGILPAKPALRRNSLNPRRHSERRAFESPPPHVPVLPAFSARFSLNKITFRY
jgi:hypothetical protein